MRYILRSDRPQPQARSHADGLPVVIVVMIVTYLLAIVAAVLGGAVWLWKAVLQ
jgi:hypothetical protein